MCPRLVESHSMAEILWRNDLSSENAHLSPQLQQTSSPLMLHGLRPWSRSGENVRHSCAERCALSLLASWCPNETRSEWARVASSRRMVAFDSQHCTESTYSSLQNLAMIPVFCAMLTNAIYLCVGIATPATSNRNALHILFRKEKITPTLHTLCALSYVFHEHITADALIFKPT